MGVAGWALCLTAGVLLAPTDARASCGDYVVVNGRPAGMTTAHGTAMPTDPGRPAPAGAPARPCSGASCSAGHRVPLAPVPTNPAPTGQEWGTASQPLDLALPCPAGRLTGVRFTPSPNAPQDIFHPPRASA